MPITGHPLHRSGRAALPHPAPTLGDERHALGGRRMTDARDGERVPAGPPHGLEGAEEPRVVECVEPRMSASSTQFTFAVNRCFRSRLAA